MQGTEPTTISRPPTAQIVAVGSEMLTPDRVDTNSLFLTSELNAIGIEVERKTVVGDDEVQIRDAINSALKRSTLLLLTGGLGPTSDDITREVVARMFKRPLEFDELVMKAIEERARLFHFAVGEKNRRQAMVPQGATVLSNPNGTAPGLYLKEGPTHIFLLPGPPRELKPMVQSTVMRLLRKSLPVCPGFARHISIASMAESQVDARIEPVYSRYSDVTTTILSSAGIIDVHFSCPGTIPDAEEKLDRLLADVNAELGDAVFSISGESLSSVTGKRLVERGHDVATAESCTGGLLAKLLTDTPGSSAYFRGSVVAYSNELKVSLLNVSAQDLQVQGAVSAVVAEQMVRGVCALSGASTGLSVTGIAGPEGGSAEKPIGLVFFGMQCGDRVAVKRRVLPGDRATVRLRAARFALDLLRRELK